MQRVVFGETLAEGQPTLVPDGGGWRRRGGAWVAGVLLLTGLLWGGIALWPKGPGDAGRRTSDGPEKKLTATLAEKIVNTLGMELVLVKPGRFQMGCPQGERGDDYEKPQHWVRITQPFYIGVHEVTQRQYQEVTGKNPSTFTAAKVGMDTSRFPVENVTYGEAEEFCRLLSEREKDKGRQYRLPTEAEWEYACRGGHKYEKSAPFYFREPTFSLDATQANFDSNFPYGGADKKKSLERTAAVGSFQPNALGLFDMHGNVWEWCADDKRIYPKAELKDDLKDPVGSKNSGSHVLRGGSWFNLGSNCRASFRNDNDAGYATSSSVSASVFPRGLSNYLYLLNL